MIFLPRLPFNKRSLSGCHSSHSNLSQASVTSDLPGGEEVDSPMGAQHTKIAERRSNSSTDIQGTPCLHLHSTYLLLQRFAKQTCSYRSKHTHYDVM